MFTVQHGSHSYTVAFAHATQYGKYPRLGPYKGPKELRRGPVAITSCTVVRQGEDGLRFLSQGLAVCTPADNFNRATSRGISFAKAMGGRSLQQAGLVEALAAEFTAFSGRRQRALKPPKPTVRWNRDTRTLEVLDA